MMMTARSCSEFLLNELTRRQKVNPRYSQRAFARQMGIGSGELSELLKGKRNLSLRSALKISKALGLNSSETRRLIEMAQLDRGEKMGAGNLFGMQAVELKKLALDVFEIVSDWYCFGILNLALTEGFRWNEVYISRRLGISVPEVRIAIQRLERVGLLEPSNGSWIVKETDLSTVSEIPSAAVRQFHKQMLQKCIDALELVDVAERDITGISFAVDPKDLPEIKADISRFQDELAQKYCSRKKKEVYHLEIGLIPLTRRET